ncbi:MAG: NrdR family transcriptional regulator [Candidatus Thorarchaeota archaeon]
MKCPNCESESTCVVTTRKVEGTSIAFRERYCKSCQSVFKTTELPDTSNNCSSDCPCKT